MNTYTIRVSCTNCAFSGLEQKEKGKIISSSSDKECPKCGCNTLKESRYINDRYLYIMDETWREKIEKSIEYIKECEIPSHSLEFNEDTYNHGRNGMVSDALQIVEALLSDTQNKKNHE